jgi:hypothetical protein
VAGDPAYFDVLNRPMADIAMRQLIIAKTLDTINLRLGHQALFPFLVQPYVVGGTSTEEVPDGWIWDMHVSMPKKWEHVRLARVKRVSGTNHHGSGGDVTYTGKLRLVFTANEVGSANEVSIFQTDYQIDSDLTYQIAPIGIPSSSEESNPIDSGEAQTIGGWATFRTLDQSDTIARAFYDLLSPPIGTEDSSGEYPNPTVYEIMDSVAGGSGDFDPIAMSHGTGLLTLSAWNPIPQMDSDIETWLLAFNYPFGVDANLQSSTHPAILVPRALFEEFNVVAPSSDEPTGDMSGLYYPVWLSSILRLDAGADNLRFIFSTYAIGQPKSTTPIEFAAIDLNRNDPEGHIVPIVPVHNLHPIYEANSLYHQGFGTGFVMLSRKWGGTTSEVDGFFDQFKTIIEAPPEIGFSKSGGRVSAFGVSRVPDTTPTLGQSQALVGTIPTTSPSSINRFVVEQDQGLGTAVDFSTDPALPPAKRSNPDIESIGYAGALAHKVVSMIVNSSGTHHNYSDDILPRLKILFGRDPQFGDFWWDGTRLKFFNGDTFVG